MVAVSSVISFNTLCRAVIPTIYVFIPHFSWISPFWLTSLAQYDFLGREDPGIIYVIRWSIKHKRNEKRFLPILHSLCYNIFNVGITPQIQRCVLSRYGRNGTLNIARSKIQIKFLSSTPFHVKVGEAQNQYEYAVHFRAIGRKRD